MAESISQLILLFFLFTANALSDDRYSKTKEPIYKDFIKHNKVQLHKLCTWNVLEWEDPVIQDTSNSKIFMRMLNYTEKKRFYFYLKIVAISIMVQITFHRRTFQQLLLFTITPYLWVFDVEAPGSIQP